MRRREVIALLGGAAAASPLVARAQQPERMRRIGTLLAGLTESDPVGQLRMAEFRRGLENLGWIDGRNIEIDARWPGASAEKLRTAAAELAAKKPDLIFAGNEAAALALQQTTTTVPIVFTQAADPVAAGLVASIARPAGKTAQTRRRDTCQRLRAHGGRASTWSLCRCTLEPSSRTP
jgi:putative ABC transport system substrate-binding protein